MSVVSLLEIAWDGKPVKMSPHGTFAFGHKFSDLSIKPII